MLINLTLVLLSKMATFRKYLSNMKKLYAVAAMLLAIVSVTSAQVKESIIPKSLSISKRVLSPLHQVQLAPLNITDAEKLDKIDEKNGELAKFSRSIYTNINLDNAGSWTALPNGDRIWRVHISAPGALGLVPLFNKFYLPPGAYLHVYTIDTAEILGAFTAENNPADGYFCTGLIHGESCIVEYYEPAMVKGLGSVNINEVGYAYRWVRPLHKSTDEFGTSGACEVNINCVEGNSYQNQKRAVVRILVQGSGGQGWCTGTLINNVRQDCTPYLLSAQHCSEGTSTNQFSQWVFYFYYEAPTCSDPASEGSLGNKVIIGCTKKADSDDGGGETGSDFLLLQLNSQPSLSYNAYFAGWNANNTPPALGVSIHHPDADIKKISTYVTPGISDKWGTATGSHWRITWSQTLNGHGVTEQGSSGGALFNTNGQIVGQLTGGNSYCNTPTNPDLFGKFSYNWVSNGATDNRRLKPWLDPDNTGSLSLNGTEHPCGVLVSNDAGISAITAPPAISCSAAVAPKVTLQNYGSNNISSVTIVYNIDGTNHSYSWSGNLAPLAVATVSLPSVNVAPGNHTITATTANPNGAADGNAANNGTSGSFITGDVNTALNFQLKTDDFGTETTWEVTDNNGATLYYGGPYPDVSTGQTYNIPICLIDGCYTLTLYDQFGDGLDGQAVSGDMKLTNADGTVTYADLMNPNFGYDEAFNFCIGDVGIGEEGAVKVEVFPNPSAGIFNVRFDNEEERKITVYNTIGEAISTINTKAQQLDINIANHSAGLYILQVQSPSGNALKKLIVK